MVGRGQRPLGGMPTEPVTRVWSIGPGDAALCRVASLLRASGTAKGSGSSALVEKKVEMDASFGKFRANCSISGSYTLACVESNEGLMATLDLLQRPVEKVRRGLKMNSRHFYTG